MDCPVTARPTVIVISDSLGDTACEVVLAASGQFDEGAFCVLRLPKVTSVEQVKSFVGPRVDADHRDIAVVAGFIARHVQGIGEAVRGEIPDQILQRLFLLVEGGSLGWYAIGLRLGDHRLDAGRQLRRKRPVAGEHGFVESIDASERVRSVDQPAFQRYRYH